MMIIPIHKEVNFAKDAATVVDSKNMPGPEALTLEAAFLHPVSNLTGAARFS